jgi:hypothetical protein
MFLSSTLYLSRAFWLDEIVSLEQAKDPNLYAAILRETHPPVFIVLLSWILKIIPETESGLRVFPLICSFLTAGVLVYLSKARLKILPLPALLFLACPMAMLHAQNLRPYTFLSLLSVLLSWFAARIIFNSSVKLADYALYTLTLLVGLLTHYWFVFLPFGIVCSGWICSSRGRFKGLFAASAVAGILFLIICGKVFLFQLRIDGAYYAGKFGLVNTLIEIKEFFPAGKAKYVLLVLLLFSFFKSRKSITDLKNIGSEPMFYFLSGSIAFLVPVFLWYFKPVLVMKGVMTLFPPVCLGVGYFIATSLLNWELLVGMGLIMFGASAYAIRNPIPDDWPNTDKILSLVNENAEQSTIVACELSFASTQYYFSRDYPHLVSHLVPLPKAVSEHIGRSVGQAEIQSGQIDNEIDAIVKSNNRLIVLSNKKDEFCQSLIQKLKENNFQEVELFSGIGDRFEKVLVFTKSISN